MEKTEKSATELITKLQALGRDVYAKKGLAYQHFEIDGKTLIEGEHKGRCAERIGWINDLDLKGKTVIDLGCNLGLFAIEAARRDAKLATGIDIQETVIQAANYIKEYLDLDNCRFSVMNLMHEKGRDEVEPADIVLAFAVYDHFTDRHKDLHPAERENEYINITRWLAKITGETMIVEFHNKQEKWAEFFENMLIEHGFEITGRKVTHIERPVFFCKRTEQAHDELVIGGDTWKIKKSWDKRSRKMYILEKNGDRFFAKRYSRHDIEFGRSPEQEASILKKFKDIPEVLQPTVWDDRYIVMPYFDGLPLKVIDGQPIETAKLDGASARMRLLSSMAGLLAIYHERREELYKEFRKVIPEEYRDEVQSGARLLVDVSPSNILVDQEGEIRYIDFEPTKPAQTRRVEEELRNLCSTDPSPGGFLSKFLR